MRVLTGLIIFAIPWFSFGIGPAFSAVGAYLIGLSIGSAAERVNLR